MRISTTLLARGLVALCAVAPLLSGCDQARESVATAIRPASAAEVAGSLREQIAQGRFAEASTQGAGYLKDKQDAGGVVAWETAKASAQAGKADEAIRFTELALRGGAVQAVALMTEPLLEPVRTDLRLVALAAGGQSPEPAADLSLPDAAVASPSTPASTSAGVVAGVKARAGDVSVELPD